MKIPFATIGVLFWGAFAFASEPDRYSGYGELLDIYVAADGVDYEAWFANDADVAALNQHLDEMAEVDVDSLSEAEEQAFYINLYNAAMIQAVLQNYPLESVTDILPGFGIFKKRYIRLGDRMLSLDDIEKGTLLKRWDEPRHHFAVNCASHSCPPLRDEPFVSERLEAQLQEQTHDFINSNHAARIEPNTSKVYVSSLFDWYADDFPGESPLAYINMFRDAPVSSDLKVAFIKYDWSLNESANKPTQNSNDSAQ